MKFKLLAGAAMAAVFAASGASAQVGWYGAVDLGYHWPVGLRAKSSNLDSVGQPYIWTFQQDRDYTAFARLGYQVTDNWRVELEGGYRPGNITSVQGGTNQSVFGLCTPNVIRTAAAPTCGAPNGKIEAWTVMGNVIFDIAPNWVIDPFIGAGAGVAHLDLTTLGQLSNVTGVITSQAGANPPIQNLSINSSATVFAYQLLAGATWKATDRLKVDATYRYLGSSDGQYPSLNPNAIQPGTFQGKYRDSSVTLGLRYSFAAPPPPPPPPAYEAKQFIVYFPFDQYILTPEAQSVVQEASRYASAGHATKVTVVGHTDTSGSVAYNVRLSERRAKAVADAMVGLGVSQSAMSVDWKGKTDLAVQTGDGVKEPLNRRSTIDINF